MAVSSGRLRLRRRRLLLLAAFLLVGGLVVATLGSGEAPRNQDDPENLSYGIKYHGLPQNDCWSHHRGEGMYDSHVVVPLYPQAIEVGKTRELKLQVYNAWKYDISEIKVNLTLPKGENFLVPRVGEIVEAEKGAHYTFHGRLGNPNLRGLPNVEESWKNFTFDVSNAATFIDGRLSIYYPQNVGDLPGVGPQAPPLNQLESNFYTPGGTIPFKFLPDDKTAPERNMTLPRGGANGIAVVPGAWRVELRYLGNAAEYAEYFFDVNVAHGVGANEGQTFSVVNLLREPSDPQAIPQTRIPPYSVLDLPPIPIEGLAPGTQTIRVMVEARLWYKHDDPKTPSEDSFRRWATFQIEVGDQYIPPLSAGAVAGIPKAPLFLVAGETTGFAAGILLLPSLLLGGTYGRASRKLFNLLLGGAKRRVMFHNLLSLGLTLVALVHIVLFLLEIRYTVLMGVLWGGLGALSLLVLGLSGYYQVPLIQRYGYNWWRVTHLVFGLLVVLFVAWHSVADGDDFFFVKEQLPQWLNALNLAQK